MTALTGTWRMARLVVRRDRLRLALWVLGLVVTMVASAASLLGVYPDQRAIDSYGEIFGDNPALVAFAGPGYGLDHPTIGAILVNETQLWGAIAIALMGIFGVVRHTRAEEDAERADLLLSSSVGRHAPLVAAVSVLAVAEAVVAVACAVGFVALGYSTVGSCALAASWLAVGVVFIGVGAIVAQLASTARGALGLGALTLAVAFVLRAVGDIASNALVWTSPIGWAQAIRAYAGERWWTVVLCAAAAVAATAVSVVLASRRDLGGGVLRPRPGAAHAAPWSTTPLGLCWRQQRLAFVSWVIGLGLVGAVYGSVADDIESVLADNPQLAEILAALGAADITDAYVATAVVMMAIAATGFAVATALAAHRDEEQGRAELTYSAPLPRSRWLRAAAVVAGLGSAVVVLTAGAAFGLVAAVVLDDPALVGRCLLAAAATVPALWVVLGITVLVVGSLPRLAEAAWGVVAVVAVVGFLGDALDLPAWVRRLSPFHYLPAVPAEDPSALVAAVATALAVGLAGGGLAALDRRDA